MKVLYIGQYTEGTTSKMRADIINNLLEPELFEVIDTHIPFFQTNRILRSLGFRFKRGPLIKKTNAFIAQQIQNDKYDLIWVDKGVFIKKETTFMLRSKTDKLVHFTPDPAFTFHKSKLFNASIAIYDFLITTKSFEVDTYRELAKDSKVLFTSQGFDKRIHRKSENIFSEKSGLLFIGHHEDYREKIINELLQNNINVTLAGIKWARFASKNKHNQLLNYLGEGVYGDDYVREIQNAKIAWGALSKWIPELHTTRTFEIPACGTALLTERNKETNHFFNEEEVIFYNDDEELINKVKYYISQNARLETITENGYKKVVENGYDYETILENVLKKIDLL